MKTVDYSVAVYPQKLPVLEQTLDFMQVGAKEAVASVILGILNGQYVTNSVVILYGCVNSGSGLNYIISAGAVYYNGEYFDVPAATFTAGAGQVAVGTITTTQDPVDPVKLQPSGTNVSVHDIRKIVIAAGTSGSGTKDYSDFISYKNEKFEAETVPNTSITDNTGASHYTVSTFTAVKLAGTREVRVCFEHQPSNSQAISIIIRFKVNAVTAYTYTVQEPNAGTTLSRIVSVGKTLALVVGDIVTVTISGTAAAPGVSTVIGGESTMRLE